MAWAVCSKQNSQPTLKARRPTSIMLAMSHFGSPDGLLSHLRCPLKSSPISNQSTGDGLMKPTKLACSHVASHLCDPVTPKHMLPLTDMFTSAPLSVGPIRGLAHPQFSACSEHGRPSSPSLSTLNAPNCAHRLHRGLLGAGWDPVSRRLGGSESTRGVWKDCVIGR